MKKLFILLQFSIFNFQYSIAQQDSLRGNVRDMKVYSVSQSGDSLLISQKYFDSNRNVLEHAMYNNDGELVKTAKNKFNNRNLKTEEAEYDANNKLHGKMTYKYNDKGEITEEVRYEREDEWEYKITSAFDKAGNKTSEIKTSEEGALMKKKLFNHDANGNVTGEKNYDAKDSLNVWYSRKYDSRNNLIEEIRYLLGKEQWKVNYTFNSVNKKESETHTYPFTRSNNSIVWSYDDQQRLIEEITYDYQHKVIQKNSFMYVNGKLKSENKNNSVTEFEYDSLGNKMKEQVSSGKIIFSEKYFDAKGNVLKWLHYNKGDLSFLETFLYDSLRMNLMRSTKRDNTDVVLEENEYRYDAIGNMIEEVNKGVGGKFIFRKVFVYSYY